MNTHTDIAITQVKLTDIDLLQQIGKETFIQTFSDTNTEENMNTYLAEGFSKEKLLSELCDNESEFYFAVLKNDVIGYLKVNTGQAQTEQQCPQALEIERIYVLQEFQGRKVGQLLFEKALALAQIKAASFIWLGVWEKNLRAINFYQKNGFVAFDQHIFQLGDDKQIDIMMKKQYNRTMHEFIAENIQVIQQRIDEACKASRRDPREVKLLLATKTVPAERIEIALQAGQTLIAENKVQELKDKFEYLNAVPHVNHFIGHLQTNKIKDLLKCNVSCIHSIDRIDLAEKLHQRLLKEDKTMEVLIQVNTSFEESKYGAAPEEVIGLVQQIATLSTLKIKGLMTIGILSAEAEQVRACFQLLKQIQQQIIALAIPGVSMQELSMGMSGDLEIAIAEGATIVRVGTAIFGQRPTPDSYYWNEHN